MADSSGLLVEYAEAGRQILTVQYTETHYDGYWRWDRRRQGDDDPRGSHCQRQSRHRV